MLRRYWLAIFALGLAVVSLSAWYGWQEVNRYQVEHAQQRQSVSAYSEETTEKYWDVCASGGLLQAFECLSNSLDASREAQRSKYDLQAQQDMAEWAYGLLLLSLVGLLISVAGLLSILISLRLAREANHAAINAVTVTREIGEAQARAYLSITGAYLTWDREINYPGLCITLKNSGQSPARNIEAVARFQFFPAGKTMHKIGPTDSYAVLWHNDLSAGDEDTPPTMFLSDATIDKSVWGESLENMAGVHIDIVVYAEDVFDKEVTAYKHYSAAWTPDADRFQRHSLIDFGSVFTGKVGDTFTENLRVHLNKRKKP